MAGTYGVKITANVKDAESNLDQLNQRLAAMKAQLATMSAPSKKFTDQFNALQRHASAVGKVRDEMVKPMEDAKKRMGAALTDLKGRFSGLGSTARGAARSIMSVLPGIGLLTGAASVGGMAKLLEDTGKWAQQLQISAKILGVNTDHMQALQGASTLAGLGGNTVANSVQSLQDKQRAAQLGLDPQAMQLFSAAGMDVNADPEENLKKLLDRVGKSNASAATKRATLQQFGVDPSMERFGSGAEYQKYIDDAKKYNNVSAQNIKQSADLYEAYNKSKMAVTSFAETIAGELSPALTPLLTQFADWIAKSPEVRDFTKQMGERAKEFAAWIKTIDFRQLWDDIKTVFKGIKEGIDAVGGLKNALEILLGVKVALWAGGTAFKVLELVKAVQALTAASQAAGELGLLGKVGRLGGLVSGGAVAAGAAATLAGGAIVGLGGALVDQVAGHEDYDPRVRNQYHGVSGWGYDNLTTIRRLDNWYHRDSRTTAQQKADQQSALSQLQSMGWTQAQSAGIVGNLMQESSLDPRARNGNMIGVGQWDTNRQKLIAEHFGKAVQDMTLSEQLKAVTWEMTQGGEKRAGNALRAVTGSGDQAAIAASYAVDHYYERSATNAADYAKEDQWRGRYAVSANQLAAQSTDHTLKITIAGAPQGTTAEVQSGGGMNIPPPRYVSPGKRTL